MIWENPAYLVLLVIPIAFAVFFWFIKNDNRRRLESFAEKAILPKIVDFSGVKARTRQWLHFISALCLIVLALAGPEWGYRWQEVNQKGLEIIVAMDTSRSMLAADLKPNRLERAKLAVKDLLAKLQGDRIGLVAFAGTSYLQCPLTLDYNAFGIALDAVNTRIIPIGGTAIGAAIETARTAFKAGSSGSKILIIITDGENHEGDPVAVAQKAAREGIAIYTVGLGSPSGELIVTSDENGNSEYLKDDNGNVVKSSLNESLLRKIASASGGAYLRGDSGSLGLDGLYSGRLSKMAKGEITSKWRKRYINHYQWPLAGAVLLTILSFWIGTPLEKKRIGLFSRKGGNLSE